MNIGEGIEGDGCFVRRETSSDVECIRYVQIDYACIHTKLYIYLHYISLVPVDATGKDGNTSGPV